MQAKSGETANGGRGPGRVAPTGEQKRGLMTQQDIFTGAARGGWRWRSWTMADGDAPKVELPATYALSEERAR